MYSIHPKYISDRKSLSKHTAARLRNRKRKGSGKGSIRNLPSSGRRAGKTKRTPRRAEAKRCHVGKHAVTTMKTATSKSEEGGGDSGHPLPSNKYSEPMYPTGYEGSKNKSANFCSLCRLPQCSGGVSHQPSGGYRCRVNTSWSVE